MARRCGGAGADVVLTTALGQQLSAAGRPHSQEQTASLQTLQSRLKAFSLITIASLGIAALAMATARYLGV